MNIQFDDADMVKLQEARDKKDWRILDTWKQRFIYQKFLCENDNVSVKEIAELARKTLKKTEPEQEVIF
ncbi:hypothetical protein M0R04_12525 [Candidatus Dojkabacteria bacterium]|jgi:hypothetical protein|nr:hypothetical protein [Candidatus Dojkabacteria bacterium]